ncbi:MAG: hypothetical protein ACRDFS_06255, partial [Chloroflexota bacterium]
MNRYKRRWGARILGASALVVGVFTGFAAVGGTAGAVSGSTTGSTNNPGNPAVSYESDCTSSLEAGDVAPFVTTANIDTTSGTNFVLPQGATFGAAGALSQTVIGPVIAGLTNGLGGAGLKYGTIGLNVGMTVGATAANSSGSYAYAKDFAAVPTPGGLTSATYTSGSLTLTGNFAAADAETGAVPAVGDYVAGTGIKSGTTITAITGTTSATISAATTSAEATAYKVGFGSASGLTDTDTSFATGASAFTTAAPTTTVTGTAGIGVTSTTTFAIVLPTITVTFGGASGVGTSNCLETGWVNSTTPGPSQTGATSPQLPPGTTTPLVSATPTFQSSAYANLAEPAPTASNLSVNMGTGQSGLSVTLPTAPGNPAYPVASCATTAPTGLLTVTAGTGVCEVTLSNTATAPQTDTFTFTATDDYGTPQTSAPATVTVSIGTPPVDQPIQVQVNPGQLVLSCSAPGSTGYPALTCPIITLPAVTLDGVTQTTGPTAANTIYVSDNRGNPATGWTLTTYMVATSTSLNTNPTCAGLAVFCNSSVGSSASNPNGQIPGSDLAISAPTCAPYTGNLNVAPTAGSGGTYATTQTLCTA